MAQQNSKLKVLHLITDLGKGGAERFLFDLCSSASSRRPDVEFCIAVLFENDRYGFSDLDIPVVPLDFSVFSFRSKNECPKYQRLLAEFKPDVIHTHRFLAEFLSAQYLSYEAAYVCHGHDNMVQFAEADIGLLGNKARFTNFLEKRLIYSRKYRKVRTWFVANSNHTLEYYKRVLPNSMSNDVRLINYGFDFERFHSGCRKELSSPDISTRPVRLINVGSFQDKKNQKFIVDIAIELERLGLDFRIDLLGDGQNRANVQAAIDHSGLSEKVKLHGNVDNVEEWLWRSDIYLHTAWYEPFGLVFLEAMAAGLPCVVLDGKGNRDVMVQGENGFLIETENAKEFADKIKLLSTDSDTYRRIAAYAIDFSREFDIGKATDRFIDFYRECASIQKERSAGTGLRKNGTD